jgi:protease PrsW
MDILLFLLAVVPGILVCFYIFTLDKYEREPQFHLAICFALGVLSTLPAINIEEMGAKLNLEHGKDLGKIFLYAFFVIALTEEFVKYLALMLYAYPRKAFNEPLDGVIYSVMVGMGFATLENILYAERIQAGHMLARAFISVPGHAVFAVLMGYFVGQAKFHPNPLFRLVHTLKGLFAAALFHGIYDFMVLQELYEGLMVLGTVSIYLGIVYGRKLIKKQQEISPFRDDQNDELTVMQLASLDRPHFVQDTLIVAEILKRLLPLEKENIWAKTYFDPLTGDKWLRYTIKTNEDGTSEYRLLHLPEPDMRELVRIALNTPYSDEIQAAAYYLDIKASRTGSVFRSELLTVMESLDLSSLNPAQLTRLENFIEETALTTPNEPKHLPAQHNFVNLPPDLPQFDVISARATTLLDRIKNTYA